VAVSSVGTSRGRQKSATAKGRVRIYDDVDTKAWFYPALAKRVMPDIAPVQRAFVALLDSERRVVLEVVPEKWITFDVSKMKADTAVSMAKVAIPEGVTRVAEQFGIDTEELIRRTINIMGMDKPREFRGPRKRVSDALRRIWPS